MLKLIRTNSSSNMTDVSQSCYKCLIVVTRVVGGGAERIAVNLYNYLKNIYNCQFMSLYDGGNEYDIQNYCYLTHYLKLQILRILQVPKLLCLYYSYIRKTNPNLIISINWGLSHIFAIVFSKLIGSKAIICIHSMPSQYNSKINSFIHKLLHMLVIRNNTHIIAVSNGVKDELIQKYIYPSENIHVIYNPIDSKKIKELIDSSSNDMLDNKYIYIITVGRLELVKCQHHLIRAFAVLHREYPVRLFICGIGSEESYLKKLSKDLGVESDVIFLGWQENPYKYMAQSSMFVLSSLSESFGNVIVEAMASGCPVISANCSSGVREIIGENSEYGLLAEPMTGIRHRFDEPLDSGEESLLELMQKLIEDKDLHEAYVEKGKKRAEFFSVERRIKEYELLIQKLMAKTHNDSLTNQAPSHEKSRYYPKL